MRLLDAPISNIPSINLPEIMDTMPAQKHWRRKCCEQDERTCNAASKFINLAYRIHLRFVRSACAPESNRKGCICRQRWMTACPSLGSPDMIANFKRRNESGCSWCQGICSNCSLSKTVETIFNRIESTGHASRIRQPGMWPHGPKNNLDRPRIRHVSETIDHRLSRPEGG